MAGWNGIWRGFYRDPRSLRTADADDPTPHDFPIEAHFAVSGDHLTGTMTDLQPVKEFPYEILFERTKATLRPRDRAIGKIVIERYPGTIVRSELPPESDLDGRVRGREATWMKTYRGDQVTTSLIPGRPPHETRAGGVGILYRGTLSEDGQTLKGTWEVRKKRFLGIYSTLEGRGEFELRRA
ncbi:hypothetical protein EON79_12210 [bacterium]|nr:MAG: hypothetical protein EON79_12210 [bacterium]